MKFLALLEMVMSSFKGIEFGHIQHGQDVLTDECSARHSSQNQWPHPGKVETFSLSSHMGQSREA